MTSHHRRNTTDCPGTVDATTGKITLCLGKTPTEVAEGKFWQDYGAMMVNALTAVPARHGAFLTNCPIHCETGSVSSLADPSHADPNGTLIDTMRAFYGSAIAQVRAGTVASWKAPRNVAGEADNCLRK